MAVDSMNAVNGPRSNGIPNQVTNAGSKDYGSKNTLYVIDGRTGKAYDLPILHNAVDASQFKQIKSEKNQNFYADQDELGLRIFDPGFSNTAVSKSSITYMYEHLTLAHGQLTDD